MLYMAVMTDTLKKNKPAGLRVLIEKHGSGVLTEIRV